MGISAVEECPGGRYIRCQVVHLHQIDDIVGLQPRFENLDQPGHIAIQKFSLFPESSRREGRQEHFSHAVVVLIISKNQTVLRSRRERIESLVLVCCSLVTINLRPCFFIDEADLVWCQTDHRPIALVQLFHGPRLTSRKVEPQAWEGRCCVPPWSWHSAERAPEKVVKDCQCALDYDKGGEAAKDGLKAVKRHRVNCLPGEFPM
jgi:hypothetical protein